MFYIVFVIKINNMKHFIPVHLYNRVDKIVISGVIKSSVYNCNIYRGTADDDLILEECDDDRFFQYSQIKGIDFDGRYILEYLGAVDSEFGIFSPFYNELENGEIAIVDTTLC